MRRKANPRCRTRDAGSLKTVLLLQLVITLAAGVTVVLVFAAGRRLPGPQPRLLPGRLPGLIIMRANFNVNTDLLARMEAQLAAWQAQADQRCFFLACYRLMTRQMFAGLATGRFRDQAWVTQLVHHFAGYYFTALAAYDGHGSGPLPAVWQRTFDLASQPTTLVIQHLLLGVNAHINCDLVLVLDDLLSPTWAGLAPAVRAERHHDYLLVNQIIGETIDMVQTEVVAPYAHALGLADLLAGPLDEWATARLIRNWRDDVWQRVLVLLACSDPAERAALRRAADRDALQRADLLDLEIGARIFGYPLRYLRRMRLL